jgi:hypothetical protein
MRFEKLRLMHLNNEYSDKSIDDLEADYDDQL